MPKRTSCDIALQSQKLGQLCGLHLQQLTSQIRYRTKLCEHLKKINAQEKKNITSDMGHEYPNIVLWVLIL